MFEVGSITWLFFIKIYAL